jgi:hypothetical protein
MHDRALPPGFFLSGGSSTHFQKSQTTWIFGSMQIKKLRVIYIPYMYKKINPLVFSSHSYTVILCVENLPHSQWGYQIAKASNFVEETSTANYVPAHRCVDLPNLEKNKNNQSFTKTRFESYLCT